MNGSRNERNERTKIFVVTIENMDGNSPKQTLRVANNEQSVMELAVSIGQKEDDHRRIETIRSIDINGDVIEYEIVFRGKLTLQPVKPIGFSDERRNFGA
jgi:hypothetical protein